MFIYINVLQLTLKSKYFPNNSWEIGYSPIFSRAIQNYRYRIAGIYCEKKFFANGLILLSEEIFVIFEYYVYVEDKWTQNVC